MIENRNHIAMEHLLHTHHHMKLRKEGSLMDLKQIEYILKIAEEKNITHAAEKLFITQSALNQQLLKLEKELGCPLFYRSRTDWRPTPAGEIYLETARQILMLKKDAYNQIHDLTEYQKNTIRIGFTPGRGIDMFSQVYPKFHEHFPQTRIEPNELSVRQQQDLLLSGDLDLGFMTLLPEQERTGLSYQTITEEELLLAVPSRLASILSLPDSSSGSLPVCDLTIFKEEPFVLIQKKSTARDLVDSLFETAGFAPQILFETANNQTILSMIRAEICCGILPAYYVDHTRRDVTYYRLPSHPVWNITAACRKDAYITKAAKEFISLAADYFNCI